MATVIQNSSLAKHNVTKYTFKVIGSPNRNKEEKTLSQENHPNARESDKVDSSALSSKSKESLIESLMKKTDDMSSNFIKLQMKLEAKEEEYEVNLKRAKEEAFAEGMKAGKAKAIEDADISKSDALSLFALSVKKLDVSANDFEVALEKVKENLMNAALDIAREVVNVEVSNNSANIAKILSSELIKELQSASKITLKVNPKNHGVISQEVGSLKHIEVVSDSAISEGGVVAISDAGNIDSEISKRFEKVKKAALSE
jgi:flagellar assembly protein FliH